MYIYVHKYSLQEQLFDMPIKLLQTIKHMIGAQSVEISYHKSSYQIMSTFLCHAKNQ